MNYVGHVTGNTTLRSCQRLFKFTDKGFGLGYSPLSNSDNLKLGQWSHYALALVNLGLDYETAYDQTYARQLVLSEKYGPPIEQYEDLFEVFYGLHTGHKEWQEKDRGLYRDENLEWVEVEKYFQIEVDGYLLGGTRDGLVRWKPDGKLYVFERKLTGNPEDLWEGVQFDLQPRFYAWQAEQEYGEEIGGVIYELIRLVPGGTQIKTLKDGLPSGAADQVSNFSLEEYKTLLARRARELGLDRAEVFNRPRYQKAFEHIRKNSKPTYRRRMLRMTPGLKEQGRNMMVGYMAEMHKIAYTPTQLVPPTGLSRYACQWCKFKEPCLAVDEGRDWESILRHNFVKDMERFDSE